MCSAVGASFFVSTVKPFLAALNFCGSIYYNITLEPLILAFLLVGLSNTQK